MTNERTNENRAYNDELINACDKLARRCTKICGGYHKSSWIYDKLMRFFQQNKSAVSVTIPVYINLIGEGEAIIGYDGTLIMKKGE